MSTCKPSWTLSTEQSSSSTTGTTSSGTTATPLPSRRITAGNDDRQGWWQKSVVRRSVAAVRAEVQNIVQNSPFLQEQTSSNDTIAVFHRREIETGRLIGSGGFSEVYEITGFDLDSNVSNRCSKAQQQLREECAATAIAKDGRGRFALKHLKRRLVHSPKDFQRAACDLAIEATYMSALNHPNILAVRGLPVDDLDALNDGDHDGYFLITDRLTGTLGDSIQDWKKNVEEAPTLKEKARYALQVASALRYLHSNRIVFRDLKPHNMGFDAETGAIQLFDFGLCRELPLDEHVDIDGVFEMSGVGTRRYMAPEIINDGRYNTKVDVYSWAMVVSELLTGCKPYASYSMEEHRVAVCQGGERPRLRIDWPDWLQTLLRRTWCESVRDRWSMDQVVVHMTRALREVPRRRRTTSSSMYDSPVAVHEFSSSEDFAALLPDLCHLSLPELSSSGSSPPPPPSVLRRVSLNPRLLSHEYDDDTSSLFASVMDSSLLGLTLCLEEGVEVCAIGNTLTLTPTASSPHDLPRRRMVPSCTV